MNTKYFAICAASAVCLLSACSSTRPSAPSAQQPSSSNAQGAKVKTVTGIMEDPQFRQVVESLEASEK